MPAEMDLPVANHGSCTYICLDHMHHAALPCNFSCTNRHMHASTVLYCELQLKAPNRPQRTGPFSSSSVHESLKVAAKSRIESYSAVLTARASPIQGQQALVLTDWRPGAECSSMVYASLHKIKSDTALQCQLSLGPGKRKGDAPDVELAILRPPPRCLLY